jgi:hypothetical protein
MRRLRTQRQLTGWIAVLAVLLASLAPALSHALGGSNGASWVEVCSTQGSRWVQSDPDEPGGAPVQAHLLEHCPYCSIHAPALGLPPVPERTPLEPGLKDEFPLAFLAAPRTPHAWVSAQPRGPPRLS